MSYRRPAVTVIQEFAGLVPALAAFNLPCVCVGPAYQLITSTTFGTYDGLETDYAYAGLIAGAQVDLEELAIDELFPATKKPIDIKLVNAEIKLLDSIVGSGDDDNFTDITSSVFADTLVGDYIVITPALGLTILAAQTNGVSSSTPGLEDRLTAGTLGQFADVKVGDTIMVTGGTNTVYPLTAVVTVKISDDVLKLDANINDGGGASTDVAYSITGDRGVNNAGAYRIKTKTDDNTLVLETPLVEAESMITYYVKRKVSSITLVRDTDYTADAAQVTINSGVQYLTYDIISGTVQGSYRALRNDMAANVREFGSLDDLQSFFGVDQIVPANPLAYGLSIMLQNTVTPVNGLALDENAVSDESLSFINACDVLGQTEMYAIVVLSQNPVTHQIMKAHVEGMSDPDAKKERIAFVNRLLISEEVIQDPSTTSVSTTGARIIVNTQLDGIADLATSAELNDPTTDAFLNVEPGDSVIVVGGTNAIPGTYTVLSKANSYYSGTKLVLNAPIVTGNSTDIQYYIVRRDGLESDGITFYDRNAMFIADGISAGQYLRFISGPLTGIARVSAVLSDKKLSLDQIPGIVTLTTGIEYEIYRTLSKTEQATVMGNYSHALGSRRVYNVWPDVVQAPVGQTVENLPGFYAACSLGAMVTGLPTQQGFTNFTISGFLGLEHSTYYFTEAQLDIIADGGTFIFGQQGEDQPLFVRHQLSTDRSSVKFQELSVTKNVDFIAKFIRNTYAPFIGVYNIVQTTMDELKSVAKSIITFLKDDTRLPKIGGVIRSGQLVVIEEHPTQIDTVRMRFKLDIPIPLNNLDITIEV